MQLGNLDRQIAARNRQIDRAKAQLKDDRITLLDRSPPHSADLAKYLGENPYLEIG